MLPIQSEQNCCSEKGENMTHKMITASLLTISLLASGCGRYEHSGGSAAAANMNSSGDADSAKDAIKAVEAGMIKAGAAKDSAALASSYASDAVFAVPGRTVQGGDAIGKALPRAEVDRVHTLYLVIPAKAGTQGEIALRLPGFPPSRE